MGRDSTVDVHMILLEFECHIRRNEYRNDQSKFHRNISDGKLGTISWDWREFGSITIRDIHDCRHSVLVFIVGNFFSREKVLSSRSDSSHGPQENSRHPTTLTTRPYSLRQAINLIERTKDDVHTWLRSIAYCIAMMNIRYSRSI